MDIDYEFSALIQWLKPRGLQAHTSRSQTLIIRKRQPKTPLEIRDGKLKRKANATRYI